MSSRKKAAIILAAGQGTRMESARLKVMHEVAGLPMIGHLTRMLGRLAFDRTVVVTGPGMAELAATVTPAEVAVQDSPRGTGHAVLAARQALAGFAGDVVVLFGDTPLVTGETVERMVAARRDPSDPAVAVLGFRPSDPGPYGRLVTAADGTLERIVEARDANAAERAIGLCNAGIMAFDGAVLFDFVSRIGNDNAKHEYYLTDIVAVARKAGRRCVALEAADANEVMGVNTRAELAVAEAVMQTRLRARAMAGGVTMTDPSTVYLSHDTKFGRDVTVGPNVFFGPGVTVADNVEIRAFCHIEGAAIGDGAIVGPFARLRPGARLGAEVHIGNFVEVKEATIDAGAKANHLTYIGDAHVGAGANIGAGTITCNYDGFFKYRTEIGAGAFIGSNSALVAPVKIGDGAYVGAGSVITGEVAPDALAVERAAQYVSAGWAVRYREKKLAEKDAAGKSGGRSRKKAG
jgi:bifunctional UDP-N-acetylglucosamine pyrophosphorylase/glucosamine-1-phosphate N-acetyltransferase